MSSIYRRPEVKTALDQIYAQKLAQWPVTAEEIFIDTRYGPTHLLVSGPADAPPLVLLPGLAVTSLMWLPNIAALSKSFRCYAVDLIGDYGRSTLANPSRHPRTGKSCSNWMLDLLDGLKLAQTNLLAHSHGGYVALNLAADAPQRVSRLVLSAPSGLTLTTTEVLPRIFRYMLFPNQANRNQLIEWFIGHDPDIREDFYELMWWGLQGRPKVAIPFLFPAVKLKRITCPTLLLLGEKDVAIPAVTARRRMEKFVPHTRVMTLPGASHVLTYQAAQIFEQTVLEFLDRPIQLPLSNN